MNNNNVHELNVIELENVTGGTNEKELQLKAVLTCARNFSAMGVKV